MNLEFIDNFINCKLNQSEEYIICTFYELRVKHNLTENEVNNFLILARTKLENLGYKVYFTGDIYIYNNENKIVEDNELMVAVK